MKVDKEEIKTEIHKRLEERWAKRVKDKEWIYIYIYIYKLCPIIIVISSLWNYMKMLLEIIELLVKIIALRERYRETKMA